MKQFCSILCAASLTFLGLTAALPAENSSAKALSADDTAGSAEAAGTTGTTATAMTTTTTVTVTTTTASLRGDYDSDGMITANDAQSVLNAYTEELASGYFSGNIFGFYSCDIDGDRALTAADAQYILIYYTENYVAAHPVTWEEIVK